MPRGPKLVASSRTPAQLREEVAAPIRAEIARLEALVAEEPLPHRVAQLQGQRRDLAYVQGLT